MAQRRSRITSWLFVLLIAAIFISVGVSLRGRWLLQPERSSLETAADRTEQPVEQPRVLELSPQARKNLGLISRPLKLQHYWRTILVPGEIVDRPGQSDRGVTSPAVGIVSEVHAFPGDTVKAGDRLFTLRLHSEYIQNTQSELFKATRETGLIEEKRQRLKSLADTGGIPQTHILELDQQARRQQAVIQSYRQDLLTRGLNPEQITQVSEGHFVASIDVVAPPSVSRSTSGSPETGERRDLSEGQAYEVQELKVELGAQVQAGQLLGVLANHRSLYISGHAFKREAPYLETAAQRGWPIDVEFAEDDPRHWPTLDQVFEIRHLANTIDETSRTFEFFVALSNQSRTYEKSGETFIVWRFRPGQRVRLHVPVEEFSEVLLLPAAAVAREGPEAYVFRQNGDLFDRLPVHVLHQDRRHVVIANDGSVSPGWFIAQSGAASLNRVLKAQSASGVPVGVHVHADGTVHGAH